MNMNGFLIAAPQSGSGKTTVALAVMAALRRRGLVVAPFKCGPGFIDPGYHRMAAGRISINLDGWMCSESFVRETFLHHAAGADVAVVEGVMGLFDGIGASAIEGSSAQVAIITGAPVVLVINAHGMTASAVAVVNGFAGYDERVRLAGVIFNNLANEAHEELLRQALAEKLPQVKLFGCILRDEHLAMPSRGMQLPTTEDSPIAPEYLERLAQLAERCLDLDGLASLGFDSAQSVEAAQQPSRARPVDCSQGGAEESFSPSSQRGGKVVRIAVARDAAFCFMYEDNLRLLREAGAEVVHFSPIHDSDLPPDISGLYLPGGYPELYAKELAANHGMIRAIREAVEKEMPVYAECGGFIYLTQGMESDEMAPAVDFTGIYPVWSRMLPKRKALGYRQVEFLTDSFSGSTGLIVRGYEFHFAEVGTMPISVKRGYRVTRHGQKLGLEGYRLYRCLASYIHLHFGSNPEIAPSFVATCRNYRDRI